MLVGGIENNYLIYSQFIITSKSGWKIGVVLLQLILEASLIPWLLFYFLFRPLPSRYSICTVPSHLNIVHIPHRLIVELFSNCTPSPPPLGVLATHPWRAIGFFWECISIFDHVHVNFNLQFLSSKGILDLIGNKKLKRSRWEIRLGESIHMLFVSVGGECGCCAHPRLLRSSVVK